MPRCSHAGGLSGEQFPMRRDRLVGRRGSQCPTQRDLYRGRRSGDGVVPCTDGRTRDETIEFVLSLAAPVVVGFDFSFGFPAWVARCHGITSSGTSLWPLVAAEGERWLQERPAPFFGYANGDRPTGVELLRAAETQVRAKSTFQVRGNGTVGTGSLRGMPYLLTLRKAGFAVWPFDPAGERTVVEIYPSALRRAYTGPTRTYASEHCRDAGIAAESDVAAPRRSALAHRRGPTSRRGLEGAVWLPGG